MLSFSISVPWVWATTKLHPGLAHLMDKAGCSHTILPCTAMQTGEQTDFASVHMRIFNALTSQTQ